MRAVGYRNPGPIDRPDALLDIDLPRPVPTGHDLLVEVRAVSVNPVDTKVRRSAAPVGEEYRVLGFDASGVVIEVGAEVTRFRPGDEVFYAGSIARPGTNMALHRVDERIVGHKPRGLDWAEAAALPLTSLTAWEALFDRLEIRRAVPSGGQTLLIIGGAGGVGSIAVQLARQLTAHTVITTASRPETREWVTALGAHHVLDHSQPLSPQVQALGIGAPGYVFSTTQTDRHLADIVDLIAPQGRFALIDDPGVVDAMLFKRKAVSIHLELMFTRPLFDTPDLAAQGQILDEIARLVDAGTLRTTLNERLSPINATTLRQAHAAIEQGRTQGKIVLDGGFA